MAGGGIDRKGEFSEACTDSARPTIVQSQTVPKAWRRGMDCAASHVAMVPPFSSPSYIRFSGHSYYMGEEEKNAGPCLAETHDTQFKL